MTKYQSLRTQYVKSRRKLNEQLAAGKSPQEAWPTWQYFNILTFLSDRDEVDALQQEPHSDNCDAQVHASSSLLLHL